MATSSSSSSSHSPLLDALYCEEEEELWEEEMTWTGKVNQSPCLLPILLLEQDMFWEDEELLSLFSKEQHIYLNSHCSVSDPHCSSYVHFSSLARREAVEWMLKVNSYYGFSTLTAILSINYLDRFLTKSPHLHHKNKPWMIQLAAVTCLSLAAKVEETHVPFLLDLQVEDTKYVFESKVIQKMELLVLSTLDWKMNPVTPISFLDHIIRRLGLKSHLHWEFLRRCEQLLLSIVADSRLVGYLPSVLATATMMHVIEQMEPSNPIDYQNQLLAVLNIPKEEVKHCYELIVGEASKTTAKRKRKQREDDDVSRRSPSGVIDAHCFSGDAATSSSPGTTMKKRVHEQYMPLRVFN
ncbi:hypothetical protein V2J09_016810 [Rumex salicifolius]